LVLLENTEGVTATYTPQSDFSVAHPQYGPFLLIEVVSDPEKQSDRWRMLLQAIAVCRFQRHFRKEGEDPVIMCCYFNKKWEVELYFVSLNEHTKEVVSIL
jgi:hypothetical protein